MKTTGQTIVDDYETDIIAQPFELAQAIDAAILEKPRMKQMIYTAAFWLAMAIVLIFGIWAGKQIPLIEF